MKSDIDAHRSSVDHIIECRQLSVGSDTASVTVSAANADSLADTCQRYDSLAADVDSRLTHLSELEPRWRHFDESLGDVGDWLKAQHDEVPHLREAAHGLRVSQASCQCQVRQSYINAYSLLT